MFDLNNLFYPNKLHKCGPFFLFSTFLGVPSMEKVKWKGKNLSIISDKFEVIIV